MQVEGEGLEKYEKQEVEFAKERRSGGGFAGIMDERYADHGERLAAFAIDQCLLITVVLTGMAIAGIKPVDISDNQTNVGVFLSSWSTLMYAYFAIFHASRWHATPGKKFVGLKVVDAFGDGIGPGQAILRELVRLGIHSTSAIGYFFILFTDHHQGLHDKIASTYVVDSE